MGDRDGLKGLVNGKDQKILAREIGKTQEKIGEIKALIDQKMDELPCDEREKRINDLEGFRDKIRGSWGEKEEQEERWHHSWGVYLEGAALIISIIAIIVSTLVAVGIIG